MSFGSRIVGLSLTHLSASIKVWQMQQYLCTNTNQLDDDDNQQASKQPNEVYEPSLGVCH
jgi:hypothetical protein